MPLVKETPHKLARRPLLLLLDLVVEDLGVVVCSCLQLLVIILTKLATSGGTALQDVSTNRQARTRTNMVVVETCHLQAAEG